MVTLQQPAPRPFGVSAEEAVELCREWMGYLGAADVVVARGEARRGRRATFTARVTLFGLTMAEEISTSMLWRRLHYWRPQMGVNLSFSSEGECVQWHKSAPTS